MAAVPPHLGKRLRTPLQRFHAALDPLATELPETAAALANLEEALDAELPPYPRARRVGRRREYGNRDPEHVHRILRWRVANLKSKVKQLKKALKQHEQPFAGKRALTVPCLTKVALSYPPNNARAFARSLRDLLGADSVGLHRKAIDSIRDAFVEEVKTQMNGLAEQGVAHAARAFSAGAAAEGGAGGWTTKMEAGAGGAGHRGLDRSGLPWRGPVAFRCQEGWCEEGNRVALGLPGCPPLRRPLFVVDS